MKKGFTLIELLAVIIILAIIALIVTPAVLGIISNSRKSASLRSGELYLNAVENEILNRNLIENFYPNVCEIQSDGNLLCDEENELIIDASGRKPTKGTITFENGKVKSVSGMDMGDYEVEMGENGNLLVKGESSTGGSSSTGGPGGSGGGTGGSSGPGGSTGGDTTPPVIEDVSVEHLTITITATDDSKDALTYNFDDGKGYIDSNSATIEKSKTYYLKVKDKAGNESDSWPVIIDLEANCTILYKPSKPNAPEIKKGLTPVKWDNEQKSWVVTTTDDKDWYDYSKQEWANAVILKDGVSKASGEKITATATYIKAMLVWIPRYEYRIETTYGKCGNNAGTKELPGAIDIQFISKEQKEPTSEAYHINTAFAFDGKELSGIWVGKFETSGTKDSPTILPNLKALVNQTVSEQYTTAQRLVLIGYNSHMAKNSEWGAVAYLSQSMYGKYGNQSYKGANKEVYINNSSNYYTGRSGGEPGKSNTSTSSAGTCNYDNINDRGNGTGQCGGGASTTGNITGVYDMSGGAWEYVMGNYNGTIKSAGFSEMPDLKYYDKYTSNNAYGHALNETSGWYSDYAVFVSSSNPWFRRGGDYSSEAAAGVFYFSVDAGEASTNYSFRVVLVAA